MKQPTISQVRKLVDFGSDFQGNLIVVRVKGDVNGDIEGTVVGDIAGSVLGTINGRKWELIETPIEKAIRLIQEESYGEAVCVLERALEESE